MNFDFSATLEAAKKVDPSTTNTASISSGSGKHSVTIVNNDNGMRVTVNSTLAASLGLSDSAEFLPIENLRQFLIAKKIPMEAAISSVLKERSKGKIAYNAGLVRLLTKTMRISYINGRTSRVFTNIHIEDIEGTPVAVVIVDDASAGTSAVASAEGEAESA